jgi:hypothetical protein
MDILAKTWFQRNPSPGEHNLFALTIRGDSIRAEQEQCLLRRKLDALPDYIVELANSQICRNEVFFLVNVWYV